MVNFKTELPFFWLHRKFPTTEEQIIYLSLLAFNSLLIPFIIFGIIKKKRSIINPVINTSYSSISILILNFLIFLEILQLVQNLYLVFEIIYY